MTNAEHPYDLLLLDFGGVCLLSPFELHDRAEAALGLEPGAIPWLGPIDPASDELWRDLNAGAELRERDYWDRRAAAIGELAGQALTVTDYMGLVYTPPGDHLIRPACESTVAAAQSAGLGVTVLTNDLRAFHGPGWVEAITVLGAVDHVLDCSETGILKPDPRAFAWATETTGVGTARTLFVDDQPLSVAGAEAVGIDAVWFDIANPDRSWAEVNERLGLG